MARSGIILIILWIVILAYMLITKKKQKTNKGSLFCRIILYCYLDCDLPISIVEFGFKNFDCR